MADDLDPVAPKDVGALLAELVDGESFERSFYELLRQPGLVRELARELSEETDFPRWSCHIAIWAVQQGVNAMAGNGVQWLTTTTGRSLTAMLGKCPGCRQAIAWIAARARKSASDTALRARLEAIAQGDAPAALDDLPADTPPEIKLQLQLLMTVDANHGEIMARLDQLLSARIIDHIPDDTPHPTAHFKGRAEHLATLRKALLSGTTAAICAMQGMGGVGKSTLAAQIAAELGTTAFDGGMQWVDMHGTKGSGRAPLTPVEAMREVILTLHPDAPAQLSDKETTRLYRQVLAGRRMLLIFDNARDEDQVADLVPPKPSAMIVTSRKQLGLQGGTVINLDVLSLEDSKSLFAETLGDEIKLGENMLTQFVQRCGFLPLALVSIAAALRESTWGVKEFLSKLPNELGPVLKRLQPSLDALVHDRPQLADRLARLSIMPAEFGSAAAAAIWECSLDDAVASLKTLVRRSLLLRRRDEHGNNYFQLHDLIRDLVAPNLQADIEYKVRFNHAVYFYQLLDEASDLYQQGGPAVVSALQRFDQNRAHIEDAQAFAAQHMDEEALATHLASDFPNAGFLLVDLRLKPSKQITWYEDGLHAARKLGDQKLEAIILGFLGAAHRFNGDPDFAISIFEDQLTISQKIVDREIEATALSNIGSAHLVLGSTEKAISYYEKALPLRRKFGRLHGVALTITNLAIAQFGSGNYQAALGYHEEALKITRELGDLRHQAFNLLGSARAHEALGNIAVAISEAKEALSIRREINDPGESEVRDWLQRHGIDPDA